MSIEAPVTETATPDLSSLPATAFPQGVDPSTYAASLKTAPEAASEIQTSGVERPAHIPEKFWDAATGTPRVEDMAKSYAELEQRLRGGQKEEAATSLKIEKPEGAEGANPLTSAFENFAKVYEESNGSVGEEHVAEIVKLGVPQGMIDNYLAGLEALAREQMATAYTAAGGQEKFNEASQWAAKGGLTDAELTSYNTLVSNPSTATQGVEWLISKFSSARPSEGAFVASQAGAVTGEVFRNKSEMYAAMNDPQYRANPAFRQDVAEKVARSKAANTL